MKSLLQTRNQITFNNFLYEVIRKTEEQKEVSQRICSQNDKHSEQMSVNNIWCLLCNSDLSTENRDVHFSAWFVSECKTDIVLIQTQEVWHEESDQKCMSQDTQQTV